MSTATRRLLMALVRTSVAVLAWPAKLPLSLRLRQLVAAILRRTSWLHPTRKHPSGTCASFTNLPPELALRVLSLALEAGQSVCVASPQRGAWTPVAAAAHLAPATDAAAVLRLSLVCKAWCRLVQTQLVTAVRACIVDPADVARICGLSSLQTLFLSDAAGRVASADLAPLRHLTALNHLELVNCRDRTGWPLRALSGLRALSALRTLSLRGCGVDAAALAHLSGLTCLADVRVHHGRGVGSGLHALARLTRLTTLSLVACDKFDRLTARALEALSGLTAMQHLTLRCCRGLDDACVAHLRPLHHLESLDLGNCPCVSSRGLRHLRRVDRVHDLTVGGVSLGRGAPMDLRDLVGFSGLRRLSVSGCCIAPRDSLAALACLRGLSRLDLSACDSLRSADLVHLADVSALESLALQDCTHLDDAALVHLSALTGLRDLDVSRLAVTSSAVPRLAALHRLTSLGLSGLNAICGLSLTHIVHVTALERLDLSHCPNVDNYCLLVLATLPHLHTLVLSGCRGFDAKCLTTLARAPRLRELDLAGCDQLDAGWAGCDVVMMAKLRRSSAEGQH